MNGNGYAYDVVEDFDDAEFEDYSEFFGEDEDMAERSRGRIPNRSRGRTPPPATGRGGGYHRQQPRKEAVSESQFMAALERVGRDVKANADAIKALSGRLDTANSRLARVEGALSKEINLRKKENAQMRSTLQLSALLPLLSRPKTVELSGTVGNTTLSSPTKFQVEDSSSTSMLLPLILLGGMGGGSGSNNSEGDDGGALAMVALAASGGL